MIRWKSTDHYWNLQQREDVAADLGEALFRGELALLIGSGISKPLGLSGWGDLVRACRTEVGLANDSIDDKNLYTLKVGIGDVRRKMGKDGVYYDLVANKLYPKGKLRTVTPLLAAIGALMTGSRRGKVREVWTLNFDDVLEWYLHLHGFVSQVVTEVPCLLRDVDVTVYHPHGFLPSDHRYGSRSEKLILDDTSYSERTFAVNDPMLQAIRNVLLSKIIIAIGVGWGDDIVQGLLKSLGNSLKNRPAAFWFFGPDVSPDDEANCIAHNVVPLKFSDPAYGDYAPFVLRICEQAMVHAKL